MKSLKYIPAIITIASVFSCEDFLNVQPAESISDEITIVDRQSAETALRGVYSSLANSDYYGTSYQSIGYLSGDNIQWTGSQSQVQEFINKKVNPENSTINAAWVAIYRTINRANNLLDKLPTVQNPQLTDALRSQ